MADLTLVYALFKVYDQTGKEVLIGIFSTEEKAERVSERIDMPTCVQPYYLDAVDVTKLRP